MDLSTTPPGCLKCFFLHSTMTLGGSEIQAGLHTPCPDLISLVFQSIPLYTFPYHTPQSTILSLPPLPHGPIIFQKGWLCPQMDAGCHNPVICVYAKLGWSLPDLTFPASHKQLCFAVVWSTLPTPGCTCNALNVLVPQLET